MATTEHIATTSQVQVAALNEYIKKKTEPINRKSIVHAGMESNGRVTFNHDGQQMEWRPRFRRRRIGQGAGNVANILFPQTVVNTVCTLPWRVYDLGESLSKFAKLATAGKSGWFKLAKEMYDQLAGDFIADLATKYYKDGNATGENDIHGFESWNSVSGLVSDSPIGDPDDSYAGHSTGLGVTGSWTPETDMGFPTGVGYEEYHWFSPLNVDFNATYFNGTLANFWYQWQEAIAYAQTYLMTLQSVTPDVAIFSPRLVTQMKASLQSSQRFTTVADSKLTQLGHKTLEYEGLEIGWEYGVPESVGYLHRWEDFELRSMQGQLIGYKEDHDIKTSQDLFALDSYLQLRLESPAFTAKLVGISTAGT